MKTTQRPKRAKVKPGHVIQVGDSVRVEVIGIKANSADVLIFAQDHVLIVSPKASTAEEPSSAT